VTALSLERFFSPADHAAIESAVREAETRSAGEIVPYAVERSDRYARAVWTAATLGALAGALAAALIRWSGTGRPRGA
jgi:putative membrane protein